LQRALIALGYTVGIWGADGSFGSATRLAVLAYQYNKNLTQDGIVGSLTRAAMEADLPDHSTTDDNDAEKTPDPNARIVRVTGGDAFIRLMPSAVLGQIIGVAKDGDEFTYAGETADNGWQSVIVDEETGWISGMYARLITRN
jgi:peptidoglycan hydrolase-like protein with peptidoglycan-binding domain